jgi:hypothetical protein
LPYIDKSVFVYWQKMCYDVCILFGIIVMQRHYFSLISSAALVFAVAQSVQAQPPGFRPSRFPGVNVRHVPRASKPRVPRNQLRPPVIIKGRKPGDGDMIQLDENYAVRDSARDIHSGHSHHAPGQRKTHQKTSTKKTHSKSTVRRSAR